jgi:hypothetical protein
MRLEIAALSYHQFNSFSTMLSLDLSCFPQPPIQCCSGYIQCLANVLDNVVWISLQFGSPTFPVSDSGGGQSRSRAFLDNITLELSQGAKEAKGDLSA